MTDMKEKRREIDRQRIAATAREMPLPEGCTVGVAMSDGGPLIYVYGVTANCMAGVPNSFAGYPVRKVVTGRIRPLSEVPGA